MTQLHDMKKGPNEIVQQIDEDSTRTDPSDEKRRTKLEMIGLYNLWVLVLGTVVIFASIGFLTFLWAISIKQSDTFDSIVRLPPLWMSIVRRNWASKAVTLASVLTRVALAAQLCVFAALMAALILEKVGASASDLPLLSMIRCANTGPNALLRNVFRTVPTRFSIGYSLIIVVAILNALALQFTSTILLADFNDGLVLFHGQNRSNPWGMNSATDLHPHQGADFWRSSQTSYPTFAEYTESPSHGSHGASFVDTGPTMRGFLPFPNSTIRDNIMDYSGPMTIFEERVICVKPTLLNPVVHASSYSLLVSLGADITFNNTHPDVIQRQTENTFNCTIPHSWMYKYMGFWHASICNLPGIGQLFGSIWPEAEKPYNETDVWLFLNVTAQADFVSTFKSADEMHDFVLPLHQLDSVDGPWRKLEHPNMTVDVSLCLFNPRPSIYKVQASINSTGYKRDNKVSWNFKTQRYDTWPVRFQLDAFGPSEVQGWGSSPDHTITAEDRGVLTLQPVSGWNQTRYTDYYNMVDGSLRKKNPEDAITTLNDTFDITPLAAPHNSIHRDHMWILQDVLNQTSNPAVAFQAVFHIVMQTAYYDWFSNFDREENSTISMLEPRYIPLTWKHFKVVTSLLVLHFVLLAVALVLFLTLTEMSLLGNTWQAVAQVHSTDTAAAVQRGAMATDDEVWKTIKSSGMDQGRVIIRRSERNGRQEAITLIPGR